MPLQATSGAASYDAFGGGVAVVPNYIEDVFSTFLYNGAGGSSLAINNGIDLAGKGGLVWIKSRSTADYGHALHDTARGLVYRLMTNNTNAQNSEPGDLASFNSNGFTTGGGAITNDPAQTYASWTFRKQPKFFDVVTYTGNGVDGRTVAHNLGAVPGCIIVKRTDAASDWAVYHRGLTAPADWRWLKLNTTDAQTAASAPWNDTAPTSTNFTVDSSAPVNASGGTYVVYLFAHNAGGFGLTGTDNVISCGSYAGTSGASSPVVNLGYEPQWILIKRATGGTGEWLLFDNMRGMPVGGIDRTLRAETSGAEEGAADFLSPTATGFIVDPTLNQFINESGDYIYIAIRRGPMRTPTTGTSVYNAIVRNGTNAVANVTGVGFPPDLVAVKNRNAGYDNNWVDRLRGALPILASSNTAAEVTDTTTAVTAFGQDGVTLGDNNAGTYGGSVNFFTANSYVNWFFRRAPGFFDVVCYTGTGSATTFAHNLGAVPELMIVKERSSPAGWWWNVYYGAANKFLKLNTTDAETTSTAVWNNTAPTSSVFSVGAYNPSNSSGSTYVNYLFASAPGVSKIGSYTGTGTTLQINCGFTAGARFVLIKRTDSTGDWYVWDSARGIVAGNDPYLLLNSTAAEVTSTDYIDTAATGFEISSTAPAAINASGGTYIFLAIA